MKVIYKKDTGEVSGVGDFDAGENQLSVNIDKEKITHPLGGTVVDDINNPTKTVTDLSKIKSKKKESIKEQAFSLLEEYDWYVIRKQEEGTAIPDAVSQYRSDVRNTEDNATASVEAATSASEVRSIDPSWPSEPSV